MDVGSVDVFENWREIPESKTAGSECAGHSPKT